MCWLVSETLFVQHSMPPWPAPPAFDNNLMSELQIPCEKSMCIKQGFQHTNTSSSKRDSFQREGGREGWAAAAKGVSPQPAVPNNNKLLLIKSEQIMGLMQGVPRSSKRSMHSAYPRPACGHAALRGATTPHPASHPDRVEHDCALPHSAPPACLASPRNRRARNARQTPQNIANRVTQAAAAVTTTQCLSGPIRRLWPRAAPAPPAWPPRHTCCCSASCRRRAASSLGPCASGRRCACSQSTEQHND